MQSQTLVGLVVRQTFSFFVCVFCFVLFFINNGVFPRSSCFYFRLSLFSSFGFRSRMNSASFQLSLEVCRDLRGCLHGGRKILALGRSQKADLPSAICFLYSVYMQARIFLEIGSSQLRDRKILALGRSQHHVNCFRSEDPSTRDKKNKHGGSRAFSW